MVLKLRSIPSEKKTWQNTKYVLRRKKKRNNYRNRNKKKMFTETIMEIEERT
uniref:Uncharacterized protein n=1 Tax=Octopus bimaculoides TaxID=37653 RepID=A0A0L8GH09_OCTBM